MEPQAKSRVLNRGNLRASTTQGDAVTRVVILLVALSLAGCQAPFLIFSGSTLSGEPATATDFGFAAAHSLLQLEVRPENPYSVILRISVIDGELYIDAADRRRWHRYLKNDANVRVKIDGLVYPAFAVVETEPFILARFGEERTVYRIEPR